MLALETAVVKNIEKRNLQAVPYSLEKIIQVGYIRDSSSKEYREEKPTSCTLLFRENHTGRLIKPKWVDLKWFKVL